MVLLVVSRSVRKEPGSGITLIPPNLTFSLKEQGISREKRPNHQNLLESHVGEILFVAADALPSLHALRRNTLLQWTSVLNSWIAGGCTYPNIAEAKEGAALSAFFDTKMKELTT